MTLSRALAGRKNLIAAALAIRRAELTAKLLADGWKPHAAGRCAKATYTRRYMRTLTDRHLRKICRRVETLIRVEGVGKDPIGPV